MSNDPIYRVFYAIGEFPMAVCRATMATIDLARDWRRLGWDGVFCVSAAIWRVYLKTCIYGPIVSVRIEEVKVEPGGESR